MSMADDDTGLDAMKASAEAIAVTRITIETEDGETIALSGLVRGQASYVPTNLGGYVFCNCVFADTSLRWGPFPKINRKLVFEDGHRGIEWHCSVEDLRDLRHVIDRAISIADSEK